MVMTNVRSALLRTFASRVSGVLLAGAFLAGGTLPSEARQVEDAPLAVPSRENAALQSEGRIDIADAVRLTLSRHPDIARAMATLARGRAELGAARSVWTPQLSYQANIGPNMLSGKSGSGLNDNMAGPSLTLNQLVWDFGRSKGEIGYAASTERQRGFELEAVADELAERGAVSFLDVKRFELLALETQKHVRSLERLRGLIGLRVNAGISDRSDLLLADVRVESARADEIRARSSQTVAKVALANLIGGVADSYTDPAPVIAGFAEREAEPDFAQLPVIAAAEQAEKAAAARIGQARAERYPRLGLQLGYTRNNYSYNLRDNGFTAMMTVSGDLYRRSNRYAVRAAEEDRRTAEAVKQSAMLDVRGRALTAREEIRGGYQRIDAYRHQEQQAVSASRIFFEEYKLGKRSLTDLLNAELEIYRAASARIGAEYDIMTARVRYETVHGKLRQSLGLPSALSEGEEGGR
jgi:adhesin transport system outer membrane protein